jgi:hypothetical protein
MSGIRDETTTLNYAKWLPLYEKEVPYQILSEFPGEYMKTNLTFGPAPTAETIHDIRGRESEFSLDCHGFQVCRQETELTNWTDKNAVETKYFAEMEQLLRRELKDVDEVFFYDWRVRCSLSLRRQLHKMLVADTLLVQPRRNVPFKDEGLSKVDLDDLSQYLLPVSNAHIG